MHRKAIFALAGVFLVVALFVPPVLLILNSDHDLDNFITAGSPNGLQTNGNITITDEIGENNQSTYTVAAVIEVVFVALFAVTLYYGVNHPHPKH